MWPYLDVSPTRYRFRIVNGCNSRILRLKFLVDRADESAFDDDCDGNRPGRSRQREREAVQVHIVSSDGQSGDSHRPRAHAERTASRRTRNGSAQRDQTRKMQSSDLPWERFR